MSWIYAGERKNRYELYEGLKRRYGRGNDLKCMNGKYSASCKCTGFCTYEKHIGFITDKLMEEHCCEDRDCRHFLRKPPKLRKIKHF